MTTETEEKDKKALTQKSPQVARMEEIIKTYRPHMEALLPKHLSIERMFQIALLALGRQPKLAECTAASVLGAVLESSRLGLQAGAGAGETWLVPRKNHKTGKHECSLVIDYRAIVKMIKRDARVETVMAESVRENDVFSYGVDGKPYVNWKPPRGPRGALQGYFAASWTKEGVLTAVVYKTMEEIKEFHKKRSGAGDKGPWETDEDAMCKKTVLRPLGKLNPGTTTELQRAIALDERGALGKSQDLALLADPTLTPTPDEGEEPAKPELPKRASAKTEEKKPEVQEAETPQELVIENGSWSVTKRGTGCVLSVQGQKGTFFTNNQDLTKMLFNGKGALSILFWPGKGDPLEIETAQFVEKKA